MYCFEENRIKKKYYINIKKLKALKNIILFMHNKFTHAVTSIVIVKITTIINANGTNIL